MTTSNTSRSPIRVSTTGFNKRIPSSLLRLIRFRIDRRGVPPWLKPLAIRTFARAQSLRCVQAVNLYISPPVLETTRRVTLERIAQELMAQLMLRRITPKRTHIRVVYVAEVDETDRDPTRKPGHAGLPGWCRS